LGTIYKNHTRNQKEIHHGKFWDESLEEPGVMKKEEPRKAPLKK